MGHKSKVKNMADITFANVKVHNEVEFCPLDDWDVKKQLERLFLDSRISYYEKWEEVPLLRRLISGKKKDRCTLCINAMQKERADEILGEHPELKSSIELLNRRVDKMYF
jgi:hypothetical protein